MQTAAAEGKAQTEAALAVTQESLSTAEADRTRLAAQVEDLQTRLAAAQATAEEATTRAAAAEAHAASVVEEHESAFDERRREMNRLRREHEKATQVRERCRGRTRTAPQQRPARAAARQAVILGRL